MATNNAWNSSIPVSIAQGGTNATTMATTDGVVYFDGTSLVTTAAGTATQVLTSNGAGVAPTFQAGPTIRMVLISTQNAATSTNLSFTSIGSYNTYMLLGSNITTDAVSTLTAQVSINNGGAWIATGYQAGVNTTPYNSNAWTNANVTTALLLTSSIDNTIAGTANGYWHFLSLNISSFATVNGLFNINVNTPSVTAGQSFGSYVNGGTPATVNAINIIPSTGNIVTGEFSLYGILQ